MATPWDRASLSYVTEWVPRFIPYHLDAVHELALHGGDRVLIPAAGAGAEVVAVARVTSTDRGIRATSEDRAMLSFCAERVEAAGLAERVVCETAKVEDVSGGPWDAIICAFAFDRVTDPTALLQAWRGAISPNGKICVVVWGPAEINDPFARFRAAAGFEEPALRRDLTDRNQLADLFESVDLAMVRHTVVRHTLRFQSAEAFARSMLETSTGHAVFERLGETRMRQVAARFFETTGGPDAPIVFQPAATIAIAALPGAEIELAVRSSMRIPIVPKER